MSIKIACLSFSLSDAADISNVIIAIVGLCLTFYIFKYQIRKQGQSDLKLAIQAERNIKLQWFKELVIQPNLSKIEAFYNSLQELRAKINGNDLTDEQKIELIAFVNGEYSVLRKCFIDTLKNINEEFYIKVRSNIEKLVDELTNAISDDELKLYNQKTYEREIDLKITYSKNDLVSSIYSYMG